MRRVSAKQTLFLLLPAAIAYGSLVFSDVEPARSDSKPVEAGGREDFGAETIEREPTAAIDGEAALPLPVDLVEEPIPELLPDGVGQSDGTETTNDPFNQAAPTDVPDEVALANTSAGVDLSETTTVLNVNDVELSALIKTFSKLTKRNYIVDGGWV